MAVTVLDSLKDEKAYSHFMAQLFVESFITHYHLAQSQLAM